MFAGRDLFVTACKSDFLFEVRHLLNDEKTVARYQTHFFRNRDWEVIDAAKEHIAYLDDELCVIYNGIDLRQRGDAIELRVFWRGFENGDATWEPYAAMVEDVPYMLRNYLQYVSRTGTRAKRAPSPFKIVRSSARLNSDLFNATFSISPRLKDCRAAKTSTVRRPSVVRRPYVKQRLRIRHHENWSILSQQGRQLRTQCKTCIETFYERTCF
jgi:hypothetical protein